MNKRIGILIALFLLVPSLCFGAAATHYVTPAGADTKTGATWATAMGYAEWETDFEASAEAGDIYYVAGGTYTLTSDFKTALDGTADAYIKVIGVKSGTTNEPPVLSDWAFTTDRPLMDDNGGGFVVEMDNWWEFRNFRLDINDTLYALKMDEAARIVNCKVDNSNASADRGILSAGNVLIANCEVSSVAGAGITSGLDALVIGNYIHDSPVGISPGAESRMHNNVIDTCTVGISVGTSDNIQVVNNTIYNSTTGISGSDEGVSTKIINNLFDENTAPINWAAAEPTTYLDYNSYDGDESSNVNVTDVGNSIDVDITLTDPSANPPDFTLPDSSAAEDAGLQVDTNVGVTGDYNWNIGADQTDTQVGAGGAANCTWVQ